MNETTHPITKAIELVGLRPLAAACGVSYQAVMKWQERGRLPRTEWTGETNYSSVIEEQTNGVITREMLLATPVA